ncbi:MAG: hypothetical protein IKZ71_05980 [Bacteroidales bacterium]|nr:hypothetical protein [Bacteroidales bacterium]
MDISLLSKMIGQLLLDHEEVGLPGLGAFMAEMVPASFSDKGYTINPPYRRVTFIPSRSEDDSLVSLYSESNGIDYDQSKAILQHFLEEAKKELLEKKLVVFPGLGRLRSTRQNNFFFITDEDLDIFPDGFGLAAVSLKNHVETREEVQSKVEELVSLVEGSATVEEDAAPMEIPEIPLVEPADETIEEVVAEPEVKIEKVRRERHFPKWLKVTLVTILIVAAVAAVALATFVVLAQAAPDFIDSILYTPEELRIINYQ